MKTIAQSQAKSYGIEEGSTINVQSRANCDKAIADNSGSSETAKEKTEDSRDVEDSTVTVLWNRRCDSFGLNHAETRDQTLEMPWRKQFLV